MKRVLIPALFLLGLLPAVAQQPLDYKSLKLGTPIPEELLRKLGARAERSSIDTYEYDRYKRLAMESTKGEISFALYYAFSGGTVHTGGLLHDYVNLVLDTLLVADSELRGKITVFVTNDSYVNAFASAEGALFVTTGLLARLKNEAELAFVLSHEIAHFERKHSGRSISFEYDLEADPHKYSRVGSNSLGMDRHQYSRSLEQEADSVGLVRFLQTNYRISAVDSLFILLDLADYSMLPMAFRLSDLGFDSLGIELKEECTNPPSLIDHIRQRDESSSTHPGAADRYISYLDATRGPGRRKGNDFLQPESLFLTMRDVARFRTADELILNHLYQEGLLLAITLDKLYNNIESKLLIARALYGIAFSASAKKKVKSRVVDLDASSGTQVFGALHSCNCFFGNLTKREANILSLAYAWQLKSLFPNNQDIERLMELNLNLLLNVNRDKLAAYAEYTPVFAGDSLMPWIRANRNEGTAVERLILAGQENLPPDFASNHMAKLMRDTSFLAFIEKIRHMPAWKRDPRAYIIDDDFELEVNTSHKALGIKDIIVVNPKVFYSASDWGRHFDLGQTEEAELNMLRAIKEAGQANGMKVHLLDAMEFTTSDTLAFRDMALLSSWFSEYPFDHPDHPLYYLDRKEEISELAERYGTPYALYSTLIFSKVPSPRLAYLLYTPLVNMITWPYYYFELLKVKPATIELHLLANVLTGEILLADVKYCPSSSSQRGIIQSHINDVFFQISRRPRHE